MEPVEVTHYNEEIGLVLFCTTIGGTEIPLQSTSNWVSGIPKDNFYTFNGLGFYFLLLFFPPQVL